MPQQDELFHFTFTKNLSNQQLSKQQQQQQQLGSQDTLAINKVGSRGESDIHMHHLFCWLWVGRGHSSASGEAEQLHLQHIHRLHR
jgi:hypothetical protein